MDMQTFSWDSVRVFLAVAQEGSLSKAARALNLSQPTVGRKVKALEDSLGTRLFDRLPDGLGLTAAGQELLPSAHALESDALSFLRQSAQLTERPTGRIRISTDLSVGRYLSRQVALLKAQLPEAEFTLDASQSAADLNRMEADILVRQCLPDSGNLVARALGEKDYAVYSSAAFEARVEDGDPVDWIADGANLTNFEGPRRWIETRTGAPPRYIVGQELSCIDLCAAGVGRTILPLFLGAAEPGLIRLGDPLPELRMKYWLLVHRDRTKSPLVRAGMDAVLQAFRSE